MYHLGLRPSSRSVAALVREKSVTRFRPEISQAVHQKLHFCQLYVAASSRGHAKTHDGSPVYQQKRLANTSPGFYAPSTMASGRWLKKRELPRGNLNVSEDSDHLPSLPVPNLSNTLEKLKETISPIAMNSTEFVTTLQLIDDFSKSAGPKLDLLLRNKADQTKNWMTQDWWTNEAYLKSRQPLVINSNPSMIYPKMPFEVNNQRTLISVVSQLISSIIDFKLSLIHGYNPEATSVDNECRLDPNLCYNQYRNIFGTTRIPEEYVDTLQVKHLPNCVEEGPLSIVISYRGKFFEVQLSDIENEKGRFDTLTRILDRIIQSTEATNASDGLDGAGVLTTANRDEWAKAFKLLDQDSMKAIQEAQFVVSIDTLPPNDEEFSSALLSAPQGSQQHSAALSRQILHGDSANVGNRWFDKGLQLIVVADDKAESLLGAGLNYEHSLAEGTILAKLIEYSFDKTVQKHRESSSSASANNLFAKQQFVSQEPAVFRQLRMFDEDSSEQIREHLERAKQDYISHIDQFDLSCLSYKNYGSNAIKSWRFSPDSWFQVALQLAYYNLHKRLGPCYESASTRRFAYGRTETIRSLTKEVAQFCSEPGFDTMKAAIQSHKHFATLANNGEAIDRALIGYKMTFNELKTNTWSWGLPSSRSGYDAPDMIFDQSGNRRLDASDMEQGGMGFFVEDLFSEEELHTIRAFFNNDLIKRSFRYALSTSQVSSMHPDIYMAYGPLLADGYGCCYNITGQQVVAAITANSSNQSFSCKVHELNESLEGSLDKMKGMVEEQRSKSRTN